MHSTTIGTLRVPGANLHYKVRGTGPLLLLLQGGEGNSEGMDILADHLIDYFTVVTYDRRGSWRSPLDDPAETLRLETHGDDVHHLLAALATEPALVFGGSLGALLGLDLVARHPEQVRALVAHEPPAPELLPEPERAQAVQVQIDVEETYRRDGVAAAMRRFLLTTGVDFDDREPDLQLPPPSPHRAADLEFFLTHDAPAVRLYRLDIAALKAASTRIVPAGGKTDRELWIHHCAEALADRLCTRFVEFSGGHNGLVLHPRAFAAELREVLGELPEMEPSHESEPRRQAQ